VSPCLGAHQSWPGPLAGADLAKRRGMKVTSVLAGRVAAGVGFSGSQPTCVVETADTRGAKIRVELGGDGLAGLLALCKAFWAARDRRR